MEVAAPALSHLPAKVAATVTAMVIDVTTAAAMLTLQSLSAPLSADAVLFSSST